ncbi:nucleoporin protein Ndc1-Nup [Mycotypha africana]|uniref:nucleoporin protein Ndc1-Nup n=1 Tax=Mycotypha africana TaxID=64632 RepID=UPI0023015EEA|nr:nucleoporin protein Ndc1-Nup [Mycotypha africana]KAI8975732.1 nucleoporin protein Ndc1-Nup [Mycotypha africana]
MMQSTSPFIQTTSGNTNGSLSSKRNSFTSYREAFRRIADLNELERYHGTVIFFSLFFAFTFQLFLKFSFWSMMGLILSAKTYMWSGFLYLIGAAVWLIRSLTFTVLQPNYSSYLAALLSEFTSLDNLVLYIVHVTLTFLNIKCYFWIVGEQYTSSFTFQPPGHYLGAYQLNVQHIFIIFYSMVLSLSYTYDYVRKRRYVVRINDVQQPFVFDIKTSLATIFQISTCKAFSSFAYSYIIFALFNGSFYHWIGRIFYYHSNVLDAPVVGFRWIDLHLFLRLITGGMLTMFLFNICNRLYDVIYNNVPAVTESVSNPFDCLMTGLSYKEIDASERKYVKMYAFAELATIARKKPEQRMQLFNTIGKELKDNAWYGIMNECLKVINELRNRIEKEYNVVQETTAPVAPTNNISTNSQTIIGNRLEFAEGNVMKSRKKKDLDYLDDRTPIVLSNLASEVDERLIPATVSSTKHYTNKSFGLITQNQIIQMFKEVEVRVGIKSLKPYYTETMTGAIQRVFNEFQIVVYAVQSLGSLTAASLKEDTYGYVQNDISKIVDNLLGCLVDIETYLQSPPPKYKDLIQNEELVEESEAVLLALRDAIYQIRTTFDDYLESIQVSRKYLAKWEAFLHFKE